MVPRTLPSPFLLPVRVSSSQVYPLPPLLSSPQLTNTGPLSGITDTGGSVGKDVGDTVGNATKGASDTVGGATKGVGDTAQGAGDKAKDATGGGVQTAQNPLGLS